MSTEQIRPYIGAESSFQSGQTANDHTFMQVGRAADLSAVNQADIGLVLWRRSPDTQLAQFVSSLDVEDIPHERLLVQITDVRQALTNILNAQAVGDYDGVDAFIDDIVIQCETFSTISGSPIVDIRIDHIRGNACRKFHRDNVPLRMICTYRGPGTQIVPDDHAAEAIKSQADYTGPVFELPQFSVALFKGAWQSANGTVHRSPPIEGQDISRLVVCLNTPSIVSPELTLL